MTTILETMAPIFGLLAVGFASVKLKWLDESGVRGLVFFVFSFATPSLLFNSLSGVDLPEDMRWGFLLAYYGGVLGTYAFSMAVAAVVYGRALPEQAIFGMSSSYSNLVMMGIPIVVMAFGDDGLLPLLVILSIHAATLMPLTVTLIQVGRGGGGSAGARLAGALVEVLKNPLILGILAGLGANVTGLRPWVGVARAVELLAVTAVPCSLFAMGASLAGYSLRGMGTPAVYLTGAKLVVHPLLVWILADPVLGLEGLWVSVPVVLAGMPSAVNAYLFGARYNAAMDVAARTVLLSTICSMATIAALLAWMAG